MDGRRPGAREDPGETEPGVRPGSSAAEFSRTLAPARRSGWDGRTLTGGLPRAASRSSPSVRSRRKPASRRARCRSSIFAGPRWASV